MALAELPAVVEVYDNDTFDWTLIVTQPAEIEDDPNEPVDLTGATDACMQWRPEDAASPQVALELSIANGRFFITDPANGEIAFLVTPPLLQVLEKRTYATDIRFTLAGGIKRRSAFSTVDLKSGASRCS